MPSSALKIPFGLLDGMLVEPSDVANGRACGCLCPGCGRPLVAYNQGQVRTTQYFGHFPGEECGKGIESAIHLAAKQVLLREKRMRLPALTVDFEGIASPSHPPLRTRLVEQVTEAYYESVELEVEVEVSLPGNPPPAQSDLFAPGVEESLQRRLFRPDLVASHVAGGVVDWIEICVTHEVGAVKQRWLQDAGLRVVEVDLSRFLRAPVSLENIRRAAVEEAVNKTWIAHPRVPDEVSALLLELQRDEERRAREHFDREQVARAKSPRRWLSDGVAAEGPLSIPKREKPTEEQRLAELRLQLKLAASDPWPRHLDLDISANGGCLVAPRVWLSQLFLDSVHGRPEGRFLVADFASCVAARFGVQPPYGHRDLTRVLKRRVLPYWAACGFVELLEQDVVVLTGRAQPL